jgi:hypothetical protein
LPKGSAILLILIPVWRKLLKQNPTIGFSFSLVLLTAERKVGKINFLLTSNPRNTLFIWLILFI